MTLPLKAKSVHSSDIHVLRLNIVLVGVVYGTWPYQCSHYFYRPSWYLYMKIVSETWSKQTWARSKGASEGDERTNHRRSQVTWNYQKTLTVVFFHTVTLSQMYTVNFCVFLHVLYVCMYNCPYNSIYTERNVLPGNSMKWHVGQHVCIAPQVSLY